MSSMVAKAPNPLAIQVGQRVRFLRKQKGMKQETLAAAVGYGSRSGIASIEAGDVLPSVDKALEIARVLEVRVGELLGDVENGRGSVTEEGTAWSYERQTAVTRCVKKQQQLANAMVSNSQQLHSLVAS